MKASGSISESGISGSISGQKGNVGITPTGIEMALNAGIGQLGISTDYGGGIVVGIGGQKIVWGREGGYIHYQFFGLEMIVEARDCIVVETRKLMGQIVDSHTYPDPGCKPPEPPKPPGGSSPGSSLPPGALSPADIDKAIPGMSCTGLAVILHNFFETNWDDPYVTGTAGVSFGPRSVRDEATGKPTNQTIMCWDWEEIDAIYAEDAKSTLSEWHEYHDVNWEITSLDYYTVPDSTRAKCFPETPPTSPPSAGNRPPMPQDCCKELAADLADLKEVLAVKEMLQGKLTFPWRLRMPGGQGEEVIKNYPNLARAMVQVIDHLGIHPPKLSIKDINNAIAGDQSVSNQFPSATQGFEALMAQVWDANADVDTLTNFLYRLSWLCVQQSMNLAVVSADIQSIKDMIGGKTTPDKATITTPFNIGAGIKESSTRGKGFGKNKSGEIDKRIDANTELSTESLLPDFLKIRDNDVIIERYAGDRDVVDMLSLILLKLETLSAR
ncbi:hypothetical protein [Microcoleus sp.]|uniref:hypothetical protein n=1 Tax=Microcoleus sp. TaxID=44472 RepID=UPI003525B1A4